MSAVAEAIDKMTTAEKFDTMNYLWSSLSISSDAGLSPFPRVTDKKSLSNVSLLNPLLDLYHVGGFRFNPFTLLNHTFKLLQEYAYGIIS